MKRGAGVGVLIGVGRVVAVAGGDAKGEGVGEMEADEADQKSGESVFPGPAESEAGEGDADLRDGEQATRIGK